MLDINNSYIIEHKPTTNVINININLAVLVFFFILISNIKSMENNQNENQGGGFNFRWILYGIVGIYIISRFFGGSGGDDYIEETLEDPTQGIICHLQEEKNDLFRITDEEIIDTRADSRIYATYMDGKIDTFTLDEVQLMSASDPRSSTLRAVAMGGMLGYMMGRPMSSGLSRSAYANQGAYDKASSNGRNQLRSTARKSTVRKPNPRSKSGFGKSSSSRSYGG